ncbi:PAS domain-containing protein [Phaeobacter marinintestinus]|uniref:PAS domain-containing protein n=1 Tax=Falsiphaeobacter marinintestinus TaxID=1492905 RepID=UPI001FEBBE96|nr:PAS domain-containing protein [Phaeobacter marinintestinus]
MDKVIAMDRFRSGKSLSPLRQAEAYWAALCDAPLVPKRSQIDPRGLENVLQYTFVLERIAPGIARFRLAGQHLHGLAGMEVRGMPLSAFFVAASRAEIGAVLEDVFDEPSIAELTLTGEHDNFRRNNEARMILLPLRSDCGQVDRALGVLVADDDFSDQPSRFRIAQSAFRGIRGNAPAPQQHETAGFADSQAPFQDSAPRLRLIK